MSSEPSATARAGRAQSRCGSWPAKASAEATCGWYQRSHAGGRPGHRDQRSEVQPYAVDFSYLALRRARDPIPEASTANPCNWRTRAIRLRPKRLHIDAVDDRHAVQIAPATKHISEAWLEPVLRRPAAPGPVRNRGFHSDNVSELINQVARLLDKLLIEQTKSHPRHRQRRRLVESSGASSAAPWLRLHRWPTRAGRPSLLRRAPESLSQLPSSLRPARP